MRSDVSQTKNELRCELRQELQTSDIYQQLAMFRCRKYYIAVSNHSIFAPCIMSSKSSNLTERAKGNSNSLCKTVSRRKQQQIIRGFLMTIERKNCHSRTSFGTSEKKRWISKSFSVLISFFSLALEWKSQKAIVIQYFHAGSYSINLGKHKVVYHVRVNLNPLLHTIPL